MYFRRSKSKTEMRTHTGTQARAPEPRTRLPRSPTLAPAGQSGRRVSRRTRGERRAPAAEPAVGHDVEDRARFELADDGGEMLGARQSAVLDERVGALPFEERREHLRRRARAKLGAVHANPLEGDLVVGENQPVEA